MKSKDALGDRMKLCFEDRSKNYLTRKTPVILRLDGKCFSSFCKRFEKPFSQDLNDALNKVMVYLCSNIQGAKMAERHSDEISILITDYDTLNTDSYFDYSVQKICSITASMAGTEFCRQLIMLENARMYECNKSANSREELIARCEWQKKNNILSMDEKWPVFDARCFNIPEHDIPNYFLWRNQDSVRNSINMHAQSLFSHKELIGKNCDQMQEIMFQTHGFNWNDLPQERKTGFFCIKERVEKEIDKGPKKGEKYFRSSWAVIPAPKKVEEIRVVVTESINRLEK